MASAPVVKRMNTLIELYDPMPINNVLGTEMFRPRETVFICPPEVERNRELRRSLKRYFEHRQCPVRLTFIPVSMLDAVKIERVLREVLSSRPDCAIDISGGTDAALFAAGAASGDLPVFTYSRRKNTFYEIKNAPFAKGQRCTVRLDAESCFLMAGGTLLPGREDNRKLRDRVELIDRLFSVFTQYRRIWNRQVSYIQKVSSSEPGVLEAAGSLTEKAGGKYVTVNPGLLRALNASGLIQDLRLSGDRVTFAFPDEVVRFWLRDIGAVLELQVYRACLAAGCFDDVVLSAVVNWQGGQSQRDGVTNEIDIVAVRGIQPTFISCKTSEIRTEALNELAILRDRFGGRSSRALIVTSAPSTRNRALMRRRAAELNIETVEWEDLGLDRLTERVAGQVTIHGGGSRQ